MPDHARPPAGQASRSPAHPLHPPGPVLLDLADVAGASDQDRGRLAGWLERGRPGLASRFDEQTRLCADHDVRAGEDIRLRTFASFALLFARTADPGQRNAQLKQLDSENFCGHLGLRWPLLPSTSPAEPAFEPRNYWRGRSGRSSTGCCGSRWAGSAARPRGGDPPRLPAPDCRR